MKKLLPFVLVVNLFLLGCKEKSSIPLEIANQFVSQMENYKAISYDIDYQIKYFSSVEDTTKISAAVDLVRETSDSIFGGYIWITADSVSTYYNTEALYSINHVTNKIIKYPKKKTAPLTGTNRRALYNTYFLKPGKLINAINDSTNLVTVTKEIHSIGEAWRFKYEINELGDVSQIRKNIWIDEVSLIPFQINYFAESQGEQQYDKWLIKNVIPDNISIDALEERLSSFKKQYELEEFTEKEENQATSLPNGASIPNLKGVTYSDSIVVNLNDFRNKLTLYDIWYIDCPPCVKAIPHLNDLYNKYADLGLKVVGVNPFNNNEKDLKRLPNFLNYNKMDYPIVFVDRAQSKELQVQAYPTFYLVDSKGIVLHSEVGFNEEKAKIFDSQIGEYLKNN